MSPMTEPGAQPPFLNRELSWLAFNERVLGEASDTSLPPLERLKFLGIVSSNLDEFFMMRVSGLRQLLQSGIDERGPDGLGPAEALAAISERAHAMVTEQYRVWKEEVCPALAENGLGVAAVSSLGTLERQAAKLYFQNWVMAALTPLAVDPGHPFPHLKNKSLNLAVLLSREGKRRGRAKAKLTGSSLAVVQVPVVLPRVVPIASGGKGHVLLEDLISAHVGDLFPGYQVLQTAPFRVTRNWDLALDEEESEDLLRSIQDELRRRDRGASVRLELDASARPEIATALASSLHLAEADVYRVPGPLQLGDLSALGADDPRPSLRHEPHVPVVPPALAAAETLFDAILPRDVLLHHPFESFDPVVRLVEEAADDPNVLAIKQTLYRTSGDSPIARALQRAAENGKQVAVLVELKARLDEANNIAWARRLEESGVHVVYGLVGLKTHCKALLVVRREPTGIQRYVHLGTGNYNSTTARLYTDLSLLTARTELADDVTALFNMLTGYADPPQWKRLAVAPLDLQERILAMVEREAERARRGEPARIVAKMNSLVDEKVIQALYAASQAGVDIDLVIRGICCLRPGIPGLSERIKVTSIVDRFLEHTRIFAFGATSPEVYLSSADWMPRNFHKRVEVMFPVEDPALRDRIVVEILGACLSDDVKARQLLPDGRYVPVPRQIGRRSQLVLAEAARRPSAAEPPKLRLIVPPPEQRRVGS
jgi:polyphosphate kinase